MSIQVRFVRARPGERPSAIAAVGSAGMTVGGRLIPMALALYLTPVLLVVLLVGGLGLLVLSFVRGPLFLVRGSQADREDCPGDPDARSGLRKQGER
jgi:hypothetical protein